MTMNFSPHRTPLLLRFLVVILLLGATGYARTASASVTLDALLGGATISAGDVSYTNWRIDQNIGTILPNFGGIVVTASNSVPGVSELQFNASSLSIGPSPSDSIILGFSFNILPTNSQITGAGIAITGTPSTGAEGLIDFSQNVSSLSGTSLASTNTQIDPTFGVDNRIGSAMFDPQQGLSVATSLTLFNGPNSTASLESFSQSFNVSAVPEPGSMAILLGSLLAAVPYRLRRKRNAEKQAAELITSI